MIVPRGVWIEALRMLGSNQHHSKVQQHPVYSTSTVSGEVIEVSAFEIGYRSEVQWLLEILRLTLASLA